MLKKILVPTGVNFPFYISDVPNLPYLRNIPISLSADSTPPTKYEYFHRAVLLPNILDNVSVYPQTYLMALIQMFNNRALS